MSARNAEPLSRIEILLKSSLTKRPMPSPKTPKSLFTGIKPNIQERPRRKEYRSEPVPMIVSDDEKMVTIALTMKRSLFEQYCGNDRNKFRDAMVRQLEKKFTD